MPVCNGGLYIAMRKSTMYTLLLSTNDEMNAIWWAKYPNRFNSLAVDFH